MARQGSYEFRTRGLRSLLSPDRKLVLDRHRLTYRGPGQELDVGWTDVSSLVATIVRVPAADRDAAVASLRISLRLPFSSATLVDGALPNLDHAIPIDDLVRWPPGAPASPLDVVELAGQLAEPFGVSLLTKAPA